MSRTGGVYWGMATPKHGGEENGSILYRMPNSNCQKIGARRHAHSRMACGDGNYCSARRLNRVGYRQSCANPPPHGEADWSHIRGARVRQRKFSLAPSLRLCAAAQARLLPGTAHLAPGWEGRHLAVLAALSHWDGRFGSWAITGATDRRLKAVYAWLQHAKISRVDRICRTRQPR